MKFIPASLTLTDKEYEKIVGAKALLEEIATTTENSADYENLHYFANHAAGYIEDFLIEYNGDEKESE